MAEATHFSPFILAVIVQLPSAVGDRSGLCDALNLLRQFFGLGLLAVAGRKKEKGAEGK